MAIDMNGLLAARTLAALQNSVMGMPGAAGGVLPAAPVVAVTPPIVTNGVPGFPAGAPSSPAQDLGATRPSLEQALPLIIAGAKAQAQRIGTAQTAQPAQPAPAQGPGGLRGVLLRLLENAPQALQVGLSQDPGAALGQLIQNRQAQSQRIADQQRQERLDREREQRDFERQMTTLAISEDVTSRREDRADQRQADRDRAEFMRRQQEILGERTFRAQEAELNRMFELKRQQEAERIADEKQKSLFEQQQKQKARDFAKEYRLQGAGSYAKELGDFDAGLIDKLSPGAEKSLAAVNARVQRLQGLAARQGSGSAGEGNQLVELTNGQIVPMKSLKYNSADGSVAGFPPGTYIKQVLTSRAQAAVPTMSIEQKVEAARQRGIPDAQIIAAIQQDAPARADELIKKYNLKTQSAPGLFNQPAGQPNVIGRATQAIGSAASRVGSAPPIRPSETGLR